ncbi:MAG TPA: DUF6272 family protein [Polyangiaceae bacterium]|jgi:hypothetical protein|nr:DUF6272 family protein [Polyangiaceae bacterium]
MATSELNMERRSISLRDAWEELKRVRSSIEDYFANSSEDVRNAATMAALELAENVLKHGAEGGAGLVTMTVEKGEVVISTQNRVRSGKAATAVSERIKRITEKDARELYITRMLEIMQGPNVPESGLGLLRIAYEGSFRLSCEVTGDRVHIQARRRIDALSVG